MKCPADQEYIGVWGSTTNSSGEISQTKLTKAKVQKTQEGAQLG